MKQILIVEDDSFLNKMVAYNLTADGYGVTSALNARTAADAIRQREFNLVLLDINLPDGNGFELCKLIKPQHPDTIVIFLTANDQESDQIRGYEVGAVDYITKPFVIGALQRKIKAMFAMLEHHKPAKDIYDDGRLFWTSRTNVVKGMFELIEEALATEKYVKVKGLGTFKLTEVESRESVNVNTGERIEIQGHTKISFTPDSSMKDLINKPFAHFETVILNENTKLEDTETEIEGEEEDTVDENAPKPKQTVAAKEVELIETENTEDSPNENPIAAEDTIPVIEETIIEEPVPSVEITKEEIQIIEPGKKSEDIVTEAEKDIVVETAVPQTVSPLAETIEGNKVTDKPQEEVMTIADAAILAAFGNSP